MRTLVLSFAVALVAAGACKKDDRSAGTGGSSGSAGPGSGPGSSGVSVGSGPGSATASATAPGTVEVFVNDESVAKVSPEQIAKWPRVDTLVPEASRRLGTWATVTIAGAKTDEVKRPSANYPDMVPALFPGADGKPAFGMFDPVEHAKKGKAAFQADAIRELRIKVATEGRSGDHQGGTGEGTDPSKIVVAIKTPAGESKLTGEQILALPRESQPGHEDTKGWRLAQLLEAAGIKKFEQLMLPDATGTSVILERKELDAKTVPFIKLNKQGSLRLRVLKQGGTGWQSAGELRSLTAIQVMK
jgi:hypothetical protein